MHSLAAVYVCDSSASERDTGTLVVMDILLSRVLWEADWFGYLKGAMGGMGMGTWTSVRSG